MRVVVIGLGLFGSAVAESIVESGKDVLAIDHSEKLVQEAVDRGVLSHVACADSTSKTSLERLGVGPDFDVGVIGIGTSIEASIITAIHLKDLRVPRVIAKAVHETHRKILEKVGADETLIPEVTSGKHAARGILHPCLREEIQFSDEFSILEIEAPAALTGKTLAESNLRQDYGANVIGTKRSGVVQFDVRPDHVLEPGDVMIIGVPRDGRSRLLMLAEGRA